MELYHYNHNCHRNHYSCSCSRLGILSEVLLCSNDIPIQQYTSDICCKGYYEWVKCLFIVINGIDVSQFIYHREARLYLKIIILGLWSFVDVCFVIYTYKHHDSFTNVHNGLNDILCLFPKILFHDIRKWNPKLVWGLYKTFHFIADLLLIII